MQVQARLTKTIQRIMAEDAHMAKLLRTSQALRRATDYLHANVDTVFAEHCVVARIESDAVGIVVDGAVWASRMRYLVPQLQQTFADYLGVPVPPVVDIRVGTPPATAPGAPERTLSAASRQTIADAAEAVPPGPLSDALKRLAKVRARSER